MKTTNYLYEPTGACCAPCAKSGGHCAQGDIVSFAKEYSTPIVFGLAAIAALLLWKRGK